MVRLGHLRFRGSGRPACRISSLGIHARPVMTIAGRVHQEVFAAIRRDGEGDLDRQLLRTAPLWSIGPGFR